MPQRIQSLFSGDSFTREDPILSHGRRQLFLIETEKVHPVIGSFVKLIPTDKKLGAYFLSATRSFFSASGGYFPY